MWSGTKSQFSFWWKQTKWFILKINTCTYRVRDSFLWLSFTVSSRWHSHLPSLPSGQLSDNSWLKMSTHFFHSLLDSYRPSRCCTNAWLNLALSNQCSADKRRVCVCVGWGAESSPLKSSFDRSKCWWSHCLLSVDVELQPQSTLPDLSLNLCTRAADLICSRVRRGKRVKDRKTFVRRVTALLIVKCCCLREALSDARRLAALKFLQILTLWLLQ